MEKSVQKKGVGENTSVKDLGPCYRIERGICTKKGKGILFVERRKGESTDIHGGLVEERIHLAF